MKKIVPFLILTAAAAFTLSGCVNRGGNSALSGNFLKSADGGKTWESKVKMADEKTISSVEVLSMDFNPADHSVIFIGTVDHGVFVSRDGAETWQALDFPPKKVYGLAARSADGQIIYAAGVWQKRGKIYKTADGGKNWEEIYTEPADGTVVTALAASFSNPDLVFAGTSDGAIFKTSDGGKSWVNLARADEAVTNIAFGSSSGEIAYFLVFEKTILRTKDGGLSFEDLSEKMKGENFFGSHRVYSLAADPLKPGGIYAGAEKKLMRSFDFGDSWQEINILESSKEFPIRSIAINPQNSNEIIYSSAQALYKSVDGGAQWTTTQLDTKNNVSVIKYDSQNPAVIYLGLKKAK
jgi:photosystem II stability/assembly factor-like uncharacterized protein